MLINPFALAPTRPFPANLPLLTSISPFRPAHSTKYCALTGIFPSKPSQSAEAHLVFASVLLNACQSDHVLLARERFCGQSWIALVSGDPRLQMLKINSDVKLPCS